MLKITLLVCLLVLSLTWSIQRKDKDMSFALSETLQFTNNTSAFSPTEINKFIDAANVASKAYGQDFQKQMANLTSVLNTFQGLNNIRYFVVIQENTKTKYGYSLYARRGFRAGSLAGINRQYPTWSYFFMRFSNPPGVNYRYVAYGGKGSKITPEIEGFIFNTIKDIEPDVACDCSSTSAIQTKLQASVPGADWSIICDDSYDINAYIAPIEGQWIYLQPERCHYLIFGA